MTGVSVELVSDDHAPVRAEADAPAGLPRSIEVGGEPRELALDQLSDEGGLRGCLACRHPELFTQKDFPRAVGLVIVAVAAVLAPFTWYLSLVAAALLDAVLYLLAPEVVVCYVCGTRHRGFAESPRHPRFDREIDERLRYGAKAVMGKPMREGGTADAPEPEH
ncbi:MAG: hypothetical protein AAF682_22460 [Planctomycetota bacterium]